MTALLVAVAGTLFGVSVLSLALIQVRRISRSGWKALQFESYRRMRELYWNNLSVPERWLVYPGLIAFMTLAIAAMVLVVRQHFSR
jgi:hypothetical protein